MTRTTGNKPIPAKLFFSIKTYVHSLWRPRRNRMSVHDHMTGGFVGGSRENYQRVLYIIHFLGA